MDDFQKQSARRRKERGSVFGVILLLCSSKGRQVIPGHWKSGEVSIVGKIWGLGGGEKASQVSKGAAQKNKGGGRGERRGRSGDTALCVLTWAGKFTDMNYILLLLD